MIITYYIIFSQINDNSKKMDINFILAAKQTLGQILIGNLLKCEHIFCPIFWYEDLMRYTKDIIKLYNVIGHAKLR